MSDSRVVIGDLFSLREVSISVLREWAILESIRRLIFKQLWQPTSLPCFGCSSTYGLLSAQPRLSLNPAQINVLCQECRVGKTCHHFWGPDSFQWHFLLLSLICAFTLDFLVQLVFETWMLSRFLVVIACYFTYSQTCLIEVIWFSLEWQAWTSLRCLYKACPIICLPSCRISLLFYFWQNKFYFT